ncbi:MAG: ParB/RepB/Spo0J family partition protein [Methanoculleus sp.]|nr:ParB/RepB/Spo0J family partition protein [Methanoculleus sp.]
MKIRISKIDDSAFTVREKLNQEPLDELKESLKEDGQWDPIIVRPIGEKYGVIAGHRRVQAARELGWAEIEATVRDIDETEALFLALKTNLIREEMSPREQGKVLHQIMTTLDISQRELARRIGKSQKWVNDRIKTAIDLHPNVLKAIDEGKISWPVASRIISQLEMTPQASFLIYLLENKITTEDAARIALRRYLNDTLYTIGYEGKSLDQFLTILKTNGIETLIDVRFSVESQYKPEFSGTLLARELQRNGIKYAHRKEFGVPYEWQNPYKEGAIPFECLDKFYRWNVKKNTDFKAFLDGVKENGKTALMCYERYATAKREQTISCHRSILAAIMQETGEFKEVVHL